MWPEIASVVQASWGAVEGREDRLAERFYERLFDLDPELRPLFTVADMDRMRRKFVETLALIVRFLDDPAVLVREARRSGARHEGYGVRSRDYRTAGEALLWALEGELGPAFTRPVREAWAEAWTALAHEMSRGAAGARSVGAASASAARPPSA